MQTLCGPLAFFCSVSSLSLVVVEVQTYTVARVRAVSVWVSPRVHHANERDGDNY